MRSSNELIKNELIKSFVESYNLKNPKNKINKVNFDKSLVILNDYLDSYHECRSEPIKNCKQDIKGIKKTLNYNNEKFYLSSDFCEHRVFEQPNIHYSKNIIYSYYDKFSFVKNISDLTEELNNKDANDPEVKAKFHIIKLIFNIINNYDQKRKNMGLFIWGPNGVGKTYLMKTLINTLASRGIECAITLTSDIIKNEKKLFNNFDVALDYFNLSELCTKVKVLIIDDIGVGSGSEWERDEILFYILEKRMNNNLLTFFTSNIKIRELEKSYIPKNAAKDLNKELNGVDNAKAKRFTERIKALSKEINIPGKTHRY